MNYEGTLKFVDMGAGAWMLNTAAGEALQLLGDIPTKPDGKKVSVQGTPVNTHGYAMPGANKTIEISGITAL